MEDQKVLDYIKEVLENMPDDWLNLTTHRLDIYNESLAKTEFLEALEGLYQSNNSSTRALSELPTAYDYVRLGHPLSCVLEWAIAKLNQRKAEEVIAFSSNTTPILAILRKNLLEKKKTRIVYSDQWPPAFDTDVLNQVYAYRFDIQKVPDASSIPAFEGSTIFIAYPQEIAQADQYPNIDFLVNIYEHLGSVIIINGAKNHSFISEIQHVRRRESIAMTPANCLTALRTLIGEPRSGSHLADAERNKAQVLASIKDITGSNTKALVASSGLSTQYAIMMGLIHHAIENHPGKAIKFIVPPNCYGGTNDQARRVAACIENVEVVDLPVDGDHDMVSSLQFILEDLAAQDAIPYIIAEIPTNPRVEVPDLQRLQETLSQKRQTANGNLAIDPVFILDQTFCPNVLFLGEGEILSTVRTISYVSGSKFPSGGKCTAGYCVGNELTKDLMDKIELHLQLCDNEATKAQMEILAGQMPSMNQRIEAAYKNTRDFVNFIKVVLPEAKINFVSEELAARGFTPSVFSLDLPTIGDTEAEREAYKRQLNHKLIHLMITKIPDESKYCVSYGQLKGCYWTIPATSTQGTTKEGDKDYIARVALSGNMDLDLHKKVFLEFVGDIVPKAVN